LTAKVKTRRRQHNIGVSLKTKKGEGRNAGGVRKKKWTHWGNPVTSEQNPDSGSNSHFARNGKPNYRKKFQKDASFLNR